jgi:hypothetical protein
MCVPAPASGQPCLEPDLNCQLPDQAGHGSGGYVGATSDAASPWQVTDNFSLESGGVITSICWWGFYVDFGVPEDCSATTVPDQFTVRYYYNNSGFPSAPGPLKAGPFVQGVDLAVDKAATGNIITSSSGVEFVEYEYAGLHPPVTVEPGECVWISVQNDSSPSACRWLWCTAPSQNEDPPGRGDNVSYQRSGADWGSSKDYDLTFCVNLPLGDPYFCHSPLMSSDGLWRAEISSAGEVVAIYPNWPGPSELGGSFTFVAFPPEWDSHYVGGIVGCPLTDGPVVDLGGTHSYTRYESLGGLAGDCCAPHPTPGCSGSSCEASVCAIFPYCCDTVWDDLCVMLANDLGCDCWLPIDVSIEIENFMISGPDGGVLVSDQRVRN